LTIDFDYWRSFCLWLRDRKLWNKRQDTP